MSSFVIIGGSSMSISKITPGHNLLWESSRMMLPEHKEALIQHRKELERKERPLLSEQRIEELSQLISEAYFSNSAATIILFGEYKNRSIKGMITKIDVQLRRLKVEQENEAIWVPLEEIMDIIR